VLYGTGIRLNPGLSSVEVLVGGTNCTVSYAGPQNQYPGLDQLNVILPNSLIGAGTVTVAVTVEGRTANPVTIQIAAATLPADSPSLKAPPLLWPPDAEVGKTTAFQYAGANLTGVSQVEVFPADGIVASNVTATAASVSFDLTVAPGTAYGPRSLAVTGSGGTTNYIALPVFIIDPTLVISNLQAGPYTSSPSPELPVSFAYDDATSQILNGAAFTVELDSGSSGGVRDNSTPKSADGTLRVTLKWTTPPVWTSGTTVPISLWLEVPAGRRSNTLTGTFRTQ
jgi:hypothetical protein